MKKILLFLIMLFACCNVSALKSADIELYISNEDDVIVNESVIPYQTHVKLIEEKENNLLVEYNNEELLINKSDLELVDETFNILNGKKLDTFEKVKVYKNNGLEMYQGPSKSLYNKLDLVIPAGTEITYEYIDNIENLDNKYAYVTYEGVSGWVFLDLEKEEVAQIQNGNILVINTNSIELKDNINGTIIENNIEDGTILKYNSFTKYQYNVTYENKSIWLSINGENALANEVDIESITLFSDDEMYENPNSLKVKYTFESEVSIKPLFYFDGFYYVNYNDMYGWVKSTPLENNLSKIDPIIKNEVNDEKTVEKVHERKEIKPGIILIIILSILLLASLISLVCVVILTKKNPDYLMKNTNNNLNDNNNSKEDK